MEGHYNHSNIKKYLGKDCKSITTHRPDFIIFYASWCGACKRTEPSVTDLAENAPKNGITVSAVDCSNGCDVPSGFKVDGYPTIYYKDPDSSKLVEYQGERSEIGYLKAIKGEKSEAAKKGSFNHSNIIKCEMGCNNFETCVKYQGRQLDISEVDFLIYYADWCPWCHKAEPSVKQLADKNKYIIVAADCSNGGIESCKKYPVKKFPTIYIRTLRGLERFKGESEDRTLKNYENILKNS
uniref:Thioredoxin domain-containing protein n=1 Tax=viral metagenome TaxID=1070528 RepID=A0A6C0CMW3_9ZZZZ